MVVIIEDFLKKNEEKTLEFKENTRSMPGILKTIIAFANTAGGTIVIGVQDKTKHVVGITNPLAEQERLANVINDSIAPLIMPDIEIQSYRTYEIIVITVPHVAGPYYLKSIGIEKGTYIRLSSTNRLADTRTIQSLQNFASNMCFDELPALQSTTNNLDWPAVKSIFKTVKKTVTKNNAESLGLITHHGTKEFLSNGAVILFGKNKLKLFPEAMIRCARFLGNDRDELIDQAVITSHLPLALHETITFINRNTRLGSKIEKLYREDIPQYPPLAIREALINALVHADYAVTGVCISVAIFDDRIEITNPGTLPFGITLEKILAGSSRVRNRVIARVFHQLKLIEQWGRGIQRIVKECHARGLKQPLFEELGNQFRVTIFSTQQSEKIVDPWQKTLINTLEKKKKITTKDAAKLWDISSRAARSRLIKMIDRGHIIKTGTSLKDPFGVYIISQKTPLTRS